MLKEEVIMLGECTWSTGDLRKWWSWYPTS